MVQRNETLLLSRSRPFKSRASLKTATLSLPAPVCTDADAGALNPEALPSSGASFVVATYEGVAMGDFVEFHFDLDGPGEFKDWFSVSKNTTDQSYTFKVPKANIERALGTTVSVGYNVAPIDSSDTFDSAPLSLFIGTPPQLTAPSVDEASDHHLDVEFTQTGVHVRIPVYDGMAPGDMIYMYWGNAAEAGFYDDEIKVRIPREITFLVPAEYVAAYLDQSVNVRYDVQRDDGVHTSLVLRLRVGNAVDDTKPLAPELKEAIGGILNPDLVPNGATALVGPNNSLRNGDRVRLTWGNGLPDGAVWYFDITKNYETAPYSQHIPYEKILPFIDSTATLFYEIEQDDGSWQISNTLTVKVEQDIAKVEPPSVPQAVNGWLDPRDVSPEVGLFVIVPTNPHTRQGDALSLTWASENSAGSWDSLQYPTTDELANPFSFKVPFNTLVAGLESTVTVSYDIVRGNKAYASGSPIKLVIRQGNLQAPSIDQADKDRLNPADCPAGATVRLDATSGKFREGDEIKLFWNGAVGNGSIAMRHTVAPEEVGGDILVIVPLDTVKANANQRSSVDYHVSRASGTPEEESPCAIFDVVDEPGQGLLQVMGARSTNHSFRGERQPDRLYAFNKATLDPVEAQWGYEDDDIWTLGVSFKDTRPWAPLRVRTLNDSITINPANITGSGSVSATQGAAFVAHLNDGRVISWGHPAWGASESSTITTIDDVLEVSATEGAFAIRRSNGRIAAWGHNEYGGVIPPTPANNIKDAARIVGGGAAFAVLHTSGKVTVWGDTSRGGTLPQDIADLTDIEEVFHAGSAFAALRKSGEVVAWGSASLGGKLPTTIESFSDIVDVRGNSNGFCALRDNGTVVAWGDADKGGEVPQEIAQRNDIIELAAAGNSAFAVRTKTKEVLVWGDPDAGGTVDSDIAGFTDIEAVTASGAAFAALRSNGHVIAWGDAEKGGSVPTVIAAYNDIVQITSTDHAFAALRKTGDVVVWGNPDFGADTSSVTARLQNVRAIYGNADAFTAVLADGDVVTWGLPANGGSSDSVAKYLKSDVTYQATAAVRGRAM